MDWVQWLALTGGLVAVASFVRDRREAQRVDAGSIYVIVTSYNTGMPGATYPIFTKYEVHNTGPLPALSVSVSGWPATARRRLTWRLRPIDQWMTGTRAPGGVFPTITPGGVTAEHDLQPLTSSTIGGMAPPIMLTFRDGRGRSWVRWPDGRLNRLTLSRSAWQQRVRLRSVERHERPANST
jgi:hypothetical protein